jgi:hypothetical protein
MLLGVLVLAAYGFLSNLIAIVRVMRRASAFRHEGLNGEIALRLTAKRNRAIVRSLVACVAGLAAMAPSFASLRVALFVAIFALDWVSTMDGLVDIKAEELAAERIRRAAEQGEDIGGRP